MTNYEHPFVADWNTSEQCWDLREVGHKPRKLSTSEFEQFLKEIND